MTFTCVMCGNDFKAPKPPKIEGVEMVQMLYVCEPCGKRVKQISERIFMVRRHAPLNGGEHK